MRNRGRRKSDFFLEPESILSFSCVTHDRDVYIVF